MMASESRRSMIAEYFTVSLNCTGTSMRGASLLLLKKIKDEKMSEVIKIEKKGVEKICLSLPISLVDAYLK